MNKKIISIILARKNSKRIKNKNMVLVNKLPLVLHSINCAKESKFIKDIYVSSDSNEINKICKTNNVSFIKRSKKLSGDKIHSDEVLFDVIDKLFIKSKFDLVVFLQPTSPLRPKNVLDKAIKYFIENKADSLFSSTLFKNHIWTQNNYLKPINYDYKNRQFEQEKYNQFNENGSFYIFNARKFLKYKNRLFGRKTHYEIPYLYSFQIDEKIDVDLLNFLFTIKKI